MKKYIILFTLFLCTEFFIYAQEDLKTVLWSQVSECWAMRENSPFNDDMFSDVVDDSKNGYLSISVGWPTMGCNCTNQVGAFTNKDGSYTILNREFWECEWVNEIKSNRDLKDVFPEEFGIETFLPNSEIAFEKKSIFYTDIEIPRVGTDMKVSINTIPFGINTIGNNGLSFGYREASDYSNCKYVSSISTLFYRAYPSSVINSIINKDYENLPEDCIEIIEETLGDEMPFLLDSYDEFSKYLKLVRLAYELNKNIVYDYVILGWNVEDSRFYVKEKHKKTEYYDFKDFVKYSLFWNPI